MTLTDLTRAVAELLGWTDLRADDRVESGWMCIPPNANKRSGLVCSIPDFAHSTDAILPHLEAHAKAKDQLLRFDLFSWEDGGAYRASMSDIRGKITFGKGQTLPEACSRLLLAANGKELK